MIKGYITTAELAERWNMAEGTLRNWRYEGKGPGYKIVGEGVRSLALYSLKDITKYENATLKKKPRK